MPGTDRKLTPLVPTSPESESSAAKARDAIRRTAIFGAVAAFGLAASFFLVWIHVDPTWGSRFEIAVGRRLDDTDRPVSAAEDWRALASTLAEGPVTGLDVFFWARTAGWSPDWGGRPIGRAIRVLAFVLAALPIGSVLIGLYFFVHRGRRAQSPVLILCVLLGASAVCLSAIYEIVQGPIDQVTDPAWGLSALLAFGAALALVGLFGVKARNWWRVYGGAAITAAGLALLTWRYVTTGSIP
jgi:hypothetical protein